ncbi:MAG: methyl-accepting chemotaxis protein [Pirellulales bacterium]
MATRLSTVKKVGLGFALLTLLLATAVLLTLWQVARMQTATDQLVNQSAPMAEASLRIINGVNYSVSQSRGWVLLKDEQFKTARAEAWSVWIEPSLSVLTSLVEKSNDTMQREQLKSVTAGLSEIKKLQQQIEDISNTDKNLPSYELLKTQTSPCADDILAALDAMLDEESKLEADAPRKKLLYDLAVFRGGFSKSATSLGEYVHSGSEPDRQQHQRHLQAMVQAFDQIEASADLFLGGQSKQWDKLKSRRADFELSASKVIELRQSDKWNVALAILRDNASPRTSQIRDTLEKLITDLQPKNDASRAGLVSMTAFLTSLEWSLLIIGVIFSAGLATIIIRNVNNSITSVLGSVQEVGTSSAEISSGSQQQVASLNQTAASLNEITATAEEFKATMQEFADRARAVQEAAVETAQRSTEGRSLAQQSAARIEQVRMNSQAAGDSVLNLAEQMQRIGEITATVNEIAEQTKLLALNASIEAARAGEEGRGFAVVATQVRELANQSKDAAGRIESLIGSTQKSMQDVVVKIEEGGRLADQSTEIVRNMTDSFEKIAGAITQTTDAMSQITTGARQQEAGIAELVSSITEIDSASKESLAASEQTLRAIVSIDNQIKRLNDTMAAF